MALQKMAVSEAAVASEMPCNQMPSWQSGAQRRVKRLFLNHVAAKSRTVSEKSLTIAD